jgi:predicted acylesterase/phospholipase RssA
MDHSIAITETLKRRHLLAEITRRNQQFFSQYSTYDPNLIAYEDERGRIITTGRSNMEQVLLTHSHLGEAYVKPSLLVDGAFEGGGAKAHGYIGALSALALSGIWFKRVAGTSGGALAASLVAAGYRADLAYRINTLDPVTRPLRPSAKNSLNRIMFEDDFRVATDFDAKDDPPTKGSATANLINRLLIEAKDHFIEQAAFGASDFRVSLAGAKKKAVVDAIVKLPAVGSPLSFVTEKILDFLIDQINLRNSLIHRMIVDAAKNSAGRVLRSLSLAEQLLDLLLYAPILDEDIRLTNRAMFRFVERGGVWTGDAITGWLERHLQAIIPVANRSGPNGTVAFRDLPIDLCLTAVDVGTPQSAATWMSLAEPLPQSHDMVVYFSKRTSPGYSVSEAARRSISLPFVYYPRRINDGNGTNFTGAPRSLTTARTELAFSPFSTTARGISTTVRPGSTSFSMRRHNNHYLLDGGFRVNLPVGIFRDPANTVFDNAIDSNGDPQDFLFAFNLDDLSEMPERPPGVLPMVPPQPIKAIGKVISSALSAMFGSSSGSAAARSTAFPGLTLAAMAFRQTVDLTVGARVEREIIDLLALVPKLVSINIAAVDPHTKDGDTRFGGEMLDMPNLTKKWAANSAWVAATHALASLQIAGKSMVIDPALKPFAHELNITLASPTTFAVQPLAKVGDRLYNDATHTVRQVGTIDSPQALGRSDNQVYVGPGTFWIKTRNADLGSTARNYLQFVVDQPVRVFLLLDLAYRASGSRLPGFIANDPQWKEVTGEHYTTNDPALRGLPGFDRLFVMQRDFDAGTVQLAGARSGNGRGNRCNYSVLVVRRT